MKRKIYFIATCVFFMAFFSCKTAQQETAEIPAEEKSDGVKTYVNTGVNNATGNISTVLVFNKIIEVTGIHPMSRERFTLSEKNYSYNFDTTELKIKMPSDVPYSIHDLTFHIVGFAADPGIFVLSGIDSKRDEISVAIAGKKAVEGIDFAYDKSTRRITSLVPLNVDSDSFQICWATKNGSVNFSNDTQKFREKYQKIYAEWAKSVRL